MTTYILSTIFQGRRLDLNYWPDGNGTRHRGYVTSLSQFERKVASYFQASNINFCICGPHHQSQDINSNSQLRSAVAHLDNGDILGVTAYVGDEETNYYVDSDSDSDEHTVDDDTTEEDDDDGESEYEREHTMYNNRVSATVKRFTHNNTECYYCERSQWSGLGYAYYTSSSYVVCDSCYNGFSRSQKRTWVRCGLPWDGDAPSYPLYARSDYAVLDEVCHLQYLLTRLGYLSLSATSELTGSYQGHTKEAVRRFREHYGLSGHNMTKYDRKTAAKLAQVVRQRRRDGHSYM